MKTFGILFMLMFGAAFIPTKGHSHLKTSSLENHSGKMYIKPSDLYFSGEGIFLKTHSDEWRHIGHIYHDDKGYFLVQAPSVELHLIADQHSKETQESIWTCPSCYYENTSTNGVCDRCLWPLYESDW